jgi:hypothetical protein
MKQLNDNTTQHMLRQRLIRIETKLTHLMDFLGMPAHTPPRTSNNPEPYKYVDKLTS